MAFWYSIAPRNCDRAGVELLAPALGGGVELAEASGGAIAQQSRQAFARAFQAFAQRVAAVDDRLLQAIGRVVEADDQISAVNEHGVGKPGAGGVQPLEQRFGAIAEIAGERVAGLAEAAGDRVALGANGFDRPDSARNRCGRRSPGSVRRGPRAS